MTQTIQEHLLVCLIEECAEIQKEASKALRFGVDSRDEHGITTRISLRYEVLDLLVVVEALRSNGIELHNRSSSVDIRYVKEKHSRLLEAIQSSRRLGIVE